MFSRFKFNCLRFLKDNWLPALVIVIFFLAGIVFGAIGARNLDNPVKTELSDTMHNFLDKLAGTSIDGEKVIKGTLLKNLYIILSMYVLGLSVIGALLVPVLVFTRGFTLGFTIGFLASDQAWRGVLLSLVSVIPQNMIYIPAILASGVMTLTFSVLFIRGRFMFREFETGRPVLFYTAGMIVTIAVTSVGCLLEAYVTPVLIKYSTALLF